MPKQVPLPALIVFSSCCATFSAALADDWTATGGPPGGAVTAIAASGDRALAGAAGGVFYTAGGPWSLVPAEASPPDAAAILAVGDQFYIATRAGALFHTDGAMGESLPTPDALSIVALHETGGHLYTVAAAWPASPNGRLYTSALSPVAWEAVTTPDDVTAAHITGDVIIASPVSLWGLLRSTDRGETWETLEPGVHMPFLFSPRMFTSAGEVIYAAATSFSGDDVVIRSDDLGATWESTDGLEASRIVDLEREGAHIYAVTIDPKGVGVDIWRAPVDGGAWTLRAADVHRRLQQPHADLTATAEALLLATSGDGVLRSTDGGATWARASEGLTASSARAMAAGEAELIMTDDDPRRIWRFDADAGGWTDVLFTSLRGEILALGAMGADTYLAGVDLCCAPTGGAQAGVRLSTDGGRTWRPANNGVPSYEGIGGTQLREINAFAARGATWIGASGPGQQWPPPGSKGAAAVETGGGGVIRSTDGAASWQRSTSGLPVIGSDSRGASHYPAALSLLATADGFLMGTKGHGVFRSLDDGLSWSGSAAGIPHSSWSFGPAPIVSLAELKGAIYAATDARDVDQTVLRSTDGGKTWAPVAGLPRASALSLSTHDGRLFAAFGVARSGPGAGRGAGVWVTSDGFDWSRSGQSLSGRQVSALASLGDDLMAGTVGLGVWRLGDAPCPADLDGDGGLTFFDFLAFQNLFAAGDLRADFTGDGMLDFFDFLAFQSAFAASCD